ncbi:uncharacterized protein CEXT_585791 [Caerostris extrusa]|uniref:Uncharacterized protein n=1 Tax=Caerostris extrusa TaxID=172846 RepID=A0AAV4WFI1_CAEEX|nr:uncharacterized protein CEXT_585791 [Caerostris extrusa]
MDRTLLSIPKAGALDKYPIPAPKDLQINEFAMWKRCPTDQKHPVQKRPRKEIEFYRSKIGEQLHLRYPGKRFDQTGTVKPRIPTLTYNSLNDPYMRHYFRTLPSYKDLVDKGLVTADGKVRVDIKEFNQYRMYLHHIWTMEIDHLRSTQEMEEHKRLETLLKAVENGDSICKNIVEKQDFVNADVVMEELEKKDDILDRIKHPLVRSMLNWKYYQLRLRRLHSRYDKLREKQSKSVQPSDETPGKQAEKQRMLCEKRQNLYKKIWSKNKSELSRRSQKSRQKSLSEEDAGKSTSKDSSSSRSSTTGDTSSKDPSIEDARKSSSSSSDSTSHTPMGNYTWEDESDNTRNTFNTSDNNSDEPQRKGSDDEFSKSPSGQKSTSGPSDTWTPVSEKQDDDFAMSPPDPKWSSGSWTPVSDRQDDDFAKLPLILRHMDPS